HDPAQLAAEPGLVFGPHALGVVQAADRDVDFVREILGLEGQLRAALGAERAGPPASRFEARRLARGEAEVRPLETEPCHRSRAGGAAADRAMAVRLVKWGAGGFVADLAAEAAALVSRAHAVSLGGSQESKTGVPYATRDPGRRMLYA